MPVHAHCTVRPFLGRSASLSRSSSPELRSELAVSQLGPDLARERAWRGVQLRLALELTPWIRSRGLEPGVQPGLKLALHLAARERAQSRAHP